MENTDITEFTNKAMHLEAENESLKSILQEYQQVAMIKNIQQRELEEKASEGAAAKSSFDQQTEELKHIRDYIFELKQQAEAAAQREAALENEVSLFVSTAWQLEEIKTKYNYLQVQLDDLSERLQQMNSLNIVQQQYAGRIAELESLLANAEDEIELLKNPPEETE